MNQKEFIESVYGNKCPEAHISLWWLKTKRSTHCTSTAQVLSLLDQNNQKIREDVYIGTCYRKKDFGPHSRGSHKDISGAVGLYADIDYMSGNAHKKENLPPNQKAAYNFIMGIEIEPTIIVFTGHGLQAWWLFKEDWMFGQEENVLKEGATYVNPQKEAIERTDCWELNKKLNRLIAFRASEKGWVSDTLADLPRIFRLPGTFNCKDGQKIFTKVIWSSGSRWDPEELKEQLEDVPEISAISPITTEEVTETVSGLTINSKAEFSQIVLNQIDLIWPVKFMSSYNRERTDMNDVSESGHDFSLAVFGCKLKFTDNVIADLIVSSRRNSNKDLKLNNPKYYATTILNARKKTEEWLKKNGVG